MAVSSMSVLRMFYTSTIGTPSKSTAESCTITPNSLDLNVIDHHSPWLPKPIVLDGKQTSIHTSNKQRKLITGLSRFSSKSLITNEQPANSWIAPAMKLTTVGGLRICAYSEQWSYSLSKEAYLSRGQQIEWIPLVRRQKPVSEMW
jgi:hypothetical protein